jgi:hypothetical protein
MSDNGYKELKMRIDKRLIATAFFILLSVSMSAQNVGVGDRYNERIGGYSICPPRSWQATEVPGFKYHFFFGQVSNGFSPNINFVDQQYFSSLKEYVDLNIVQLKQILDDFLLISRTNFSTNSKLSGERLVVLDRQNSMKLKQLFYIFSKGDLKMVITCTVLADGGELYDNIFDESIKTFRW